MNTPTKPHVIHLQHQWLAEYHGPNPFAPAALVVAEVTVDQLGSAEDVLRALEELWLCSGLPRPSA